MTLERKILGFGAADDGAGLLAGYASVTGNVDRDGEVIARGAYAGLDELTQAGFLAVGHDWTGLPVGTIEEAREDDRGLFVAMRFHTTPEAQAARTVAVERIERGKSVGLSIGFVTEADHREEIDGAVRRVLDRIRVFEVSLVPVPANPLAGATAAKGATLEDEAQEVVVLARRLAERAEAVARLRAERGKRLGRERLGQIDDARRQLERVLAAHRPEPPEELGRIARRLARLNERLRRTT